MLAESSNAVTRLSRAPDIQTADSGSEMRRAGVPCCFHAARKLWSPCHNVLLSICFHFGKQNTILSHTHTISGWQDKEGALSMTSTSQMMEILPSIPLVTVAMTVQPWHKITVTELSVIASHFLTTDFVGRGDNCCWQISSAVANLLIKLT